MVPRPPTVLSADEAPVFFAADEEGYQHFFNEQGFVVVGGVLDSHRVEATVREIWQSPSLLGGHPGICKNDPVTWGGERWPAGCRNFLDPLDPCAETESWRNRLCPAVLRVFEVLWRQLQLGSESPTASGCRTSDAEGGRLVVSVDRFGVMRPTRLRDEATGEMLDRSEWRTSRNWLHFDQNPWREPGFYGVQGLLALSEASPTSGCFVTVPGFHKEFSGWCRELSEGSVPKGTAETLPFVIPLEDEMQERRVKILVPRGSLLVWDSRMPHENSPVEDESWRLVQYVTCKWLSAAAVQQRAAAWQAGLRTGLLPLGLATGLTSDEQAWLGMVDTTGGDSQLLREALERGSALVPETLEAAYKLRRAHRLQQTACLPAELAECRDLFRQALATNPALRETMQLVAEAESSYLPFWVL